jgi:hypothetical protein
MIGHTPWLPFSWDGLRAHPDRHHTPEVHHLLEALHQFGLRLPAPSSGAGYLVEDLTAVLNRPDGCVETLHALVPQAPNPVVTATRTAGWWA